MILGCTLFRPWGILLKLENSTSMHNFLLKSSSFCQRNKLFLFFTQLLCRRHNYHSCTYIFVGTNKLTVDTYTHMSIAHANIKKY